MKIGAYYYPLSTKCEIRNARSRMFGCEPCDETELVKHRQPLFDGHVQPNTYCLGDSSITNWDDTGIGVMEAQVDLATRYGIDFFVFDTYIGTRNGRIDKESITSLDQCFLNIKGNPMQFAVMVCMEGPRAIIPSRPNEDIEASERKYDLNEYTAKAIVDHCALNYWNRPEYFRINGKPYVSVWPVKFNFYPNTVPAYMRFLGELREYALKAYKQEIYLVGVLNANIVDEYNKAGVDAITGYAMLADWRNPNDVQVYDEQVETFKGIWKQIKDYSRVPFVPPAAVGWDATPRGENGYSQEQVSRIYPFFPLVKDGTGEKFERMLQSSVDFTRWFVPPLEQYGLVCAWNEIAEGAALLPKLVNGVPDFSYLQAVRNVKSKLALVTKS